MIAASPRPRSHTHSHSFTLHTPSGLCTFDTTATHRTTLTPNDRLSAAALLGICFISPFPPILSVRYCTDQTIPYLTLAVRGCKSWQYPPHDTACPITESRRHQRPSRLRTLRRHNAKLQDLRPWTTLHYFVRYQARRITPRAGQAKARQDYQGLGAP
ncbi:hypothetical protein VTL71DRAFT_15897 [Oculimacula yallundae]|uniref:Uncharacterized protein n=1 Tax=Oculimacula yallundae TaxID=86028 RepID=A0ABR4CF10_9HELO